MVLIQRAKGVTVEQQRKLQSVGTPTPRKTRTTASELGLTGEDVAKIVEKTGGKVTSSDLEKAAIEKQVSQLKQQGVEEKTARAITTGEIRSEEGFGVVRSREGTEVAVGRAADILLDVRRQEEIERLRKGKSKDVQVISSEEEIKQLKKQQTEEFFGFETERLKEFREKKRREIIFDPLTQSPITFSINQAKQEKEYREFLAKQIVPKKIDLFDKETKTPFEKGLEAKFFETTQAIQSEKKELEKISDALSKQATIQQEIISKQGTLTPEEMQVLKSQGDIPITTEIKLIGKGIQTGTTLGLLGVQEGIIATGVFGKQVIEDPIEAGRELINIPKQIKGATARIAEEPISGVAAISTELFLFKKIGKLGLKTIKGRAPTVIIDGIPRRALSLSEAQAKGQLRPLPLVPQKTPTGFKMDAFGKEVSFKVRVDPLEVVRDKFPYKPPTPTERVFVPAEEVVTTKKDIVVFEEPTSKGKVTTPSEIETIPVKKVSPGFDVVDVKKLAKGTKIDPRFQTLPERQTIFPKVGERVVIGEQTVSRVITARFQEIDPISQFETKIVPEVSFATSKAIGQRGITQFQEVPISILSKGQIEQLKVLGTLEEIKIAKSQADTSIQTVLTGEVSTQVGRTQLQDLTSDPSRFTFEETIIATGKTIKVDQPTPTTLQFDPILSNLAKSEALKVSKGFRLFEEKVLSESKFEPFEGKGNIKDIKLPFDPFEFSLFKGKKGTARTITTEGVGDVFEKVSDRFTFDPFKPFKEDIFTGRRSKGGVPTFEESSIGVVPPIVTPDIDVVTGQEGLLGGKGKLRPDIFEDVVQRPDIFEGVDIQPDIFEIPDIKQFQEIQPKQKQQPIQRTRTDLLQVADQTIFDPFRFEKPRDIIKEKIITPEEIFPKAKGSKLQDPNEEFFLFRSTRQVKAIQPVDFSRSLFGAAFNIKPVKTPFAVMTGLRI